MHLGGLENKHDEWDELSPRAHSEGVQMVLMEGLTYPEDGKVKNKKKMSDCKLGEWGLRVYFALCVDKACHPPLPGMGNSLNMFRREQPQGLLWMTRCQPKSLMLAQCGTIL